MGHTWFVRAPSGTVTFLFTDVVGSTALWERDPGSMQAGLEHHDRLIRAAMEAHGGVVFATGGDGFAVAFARAADAVAAAIDAQVALGQVEGPLAIRVRIGLLYGRSDRARRGLFRAGRQSQRSAHGCGTWRPGAL